MSLRGKVRLELDDGREIETVYDGRDLRAWEAKNRKSTLHEDWSLSMVAWFGWHAAVRRGELNGDLSTYEAFDKVCVDVTSLRDQEPPDPPKAKTKAKGSRKAAGAGSSVPSP